MRCLLLKRAQLLLHTPSNTVRLYAPSATPSMQCSGLPPTHEKYTAVPLMVVRYCLFSTEFKQELGKEIREHSEKIAQVSPEIHNKA